MIALLNRIPVSGGGAGGGITGRVVSGLSSRDLYLAISRFEDKHFPGQRGGFVDPGGAMLKRMEELAARAASAPPTASAPPAAPAARPVTAPPPAKPETVFHRGVIHDHKPSGRWAEVQANPNSNVFVSALCKVSDPAELMAAASMAGFLGKPLASAHLRWFFTGGGADFVEDANLELMLRTDGKVQAKVAARVPKGRTSGTFAGHVMLLQADYEDEDFAYSFGAIDRLDFEFDFDAGTLHAWFQDRYEWHPVYPFYARLPGDEVRPTNAVHAAGVELKSRTARDYWMKGEVTIPLQAIQSTATRHDLGWGEKLGPGPIPVVGN